MNPVFRRSVAAFLALILILPHPALALRAGLEGSVERELSAGLEEDWGGPFRRTAEIFKQRNWIINTDSFAAAFLKAEEFLKQDLAIFEQRALRLGGVDRLRRKWRKAIENKKRFLPALGALMEHLSEPASGNHALTVAHWKSSENGYGAALEYRFENQPMRAFLTVNRNPESPILRIRLYRQISENNTFLLTGQVRIGKDHESADLHSKPPLHLDILIAPERRNWLEHEDLMSVWSTGEKEAEAKILERFQDFLESLESYLEELPAAERPAHQQPVLTGPTTTPAGLEEDRVFPDLSREQLHFTLNKYTPWGFDYFDGYQDREAHNLLGGGTGFPLETPWTGFDALYLKFIQPTERTRFRLTIQSAPWFPEDRTYAIIVGYFPGLPTEPRAGLEEMASAVNALRQVPPAVPGSVGDAVLVFAAAEETGDSLVLAVQQGWTVALLDGGPRAAGLEELLRALPGSTGRYAIGVFASDELLKNRPNQIFVEDNLEGRQKVFRILGLRWDDLPPPVAAALESVLAFLDRATAA